LLDETGIEWDELSTHQASAIPGGDLFYVARGQFSAQETKALASFLERLGSCLVFLIDWNRARKRLRLLVPNETAVRILRWAADQGVGHRGFLSLGSERLVYDALEQAVKTPLRYGEPLHEMIGKDVAQDYLCYVLQTAANGLLKGQSVALIRDQVRAELFNHFRSAEQRLLVHAGRRASITSTRGVCLALIKQAVILVNPHLSASSRANVEAKLLFCDREIPMSSNRRLKQGRAEDQKATRTLRSTNKRTRKARTEELSPEQRVEIAQQIEAKELRGKPPSI
jgi:hypothetical protein